MSRGMEQIGGMVQKYTLDKSRKIYITNRLLSFIMYQCMFYWKFWLFLYVGFCDDSEERRRDKYIYWVSREYKMPCWTSWHCLLKLWVSLIPIFHSLKTHGQHLYFVKTSIHTLCDPIHTMKWQTRESLNSVEHTTVCFHCIWTLKLELLYEIGPSLPCGVMDLNSVVFFPCSNWESTNNDLQCLSQIGVKST